MADIVADQAELMSANVNGHEWDVFISHASEDKEHLVRAIAHALSDFGVRVWYDEFSLNPGDSLRRSIDAGLAKSAFGLVVLSPHFIGKAWPERELDGLTALGLAGRSRIIPLWHQVDHAQILIFSPPLADRIAIQSAGLGASELAIKLLAQVRPDLYATIPRGELERRANGDAFRQLQAELETAEAQLTDYRCRYCRALLAHRTPAPLDDSQKHWDEIEVFECGYEVFGGDVRRPCPADPEFPSFNDYEVRYHQIGSVWMAMAQPRTRFARRLSLNPESGETQAAALAALKQAYRRQAPARLDPDQTV